MTKGNQAPILELIDISKEFDGFILDSISIDLLPGEVHILVGENGSGKSTLMKLIAGWFKPETGKIIYKQQETSFKNIHEAHKNGILYLHQEIQCFGNLSVAENVYFENLPRLWGQSKLFDTYRLFSDCSKVFRELNIDIKPELPFYKLGYAERQIIFAVKGYITDADVVIFDEPSSAMSQPEREILFEIISRLKKRNTAIFYISHRLDEIERIGDRVTVMQRGTIIGNSRSEDVNQNSLVKMMTGEVQKNRYPRLPSRKGQTVLEVRNLRFKHILKGVTFELHEGEILGITGLMGSGRTLLANCLFGETSPTSGEIRVRGQKIDFKHPLDAMKFGISLIPEDRVENGVFGKHNLLWNITSATLRRFLHRFYLDVPIMNQLSSEYVKILKIRPGKLNDLIKNYSGGNQQKTMISKWLLNRSRIYIMDEPTRGIDAATKIDIYNVMNDLVAKGAAIILISSEIEETIGMSDRILVLSGGCISKEFNWEEATKENILAAATLEE